MTAPGELPPELRPQRQPNTRDAMLARARAKLDELAAPGCTDGFWLIDVAPDGMVSHVGSASLHDGRLITMNAVDALASLAAMANASDDERRARRAALCLGGTIVAQWGGAQLNHNPPTGLDGGEPNGGAP